MQSVSPFARGYVKDAWHATLNGVPVVVKRPLEPKEDRKEIGGYGLDASSLIQRFRDSATKEYNMAVDFSTRTHSAGTVVDPKHFLRVYGACNLEPRAVKSDMLQPSMLVVESGLIRYNLLRSIEWPSGKPWCFHMHLIVQLGKLLNAFEALQLTHCDFKRDQLALTVDGILKIVDLKDFRDSPYHHSQCPHGAPRTTREYGGQVGLVVADFVADELFQSGMTKPPSPEKFADDVARLHKSIVNPDPEKRLKIAEFYLAVLKIFNENEGAECMEAIDGEMKMVLNQKALDRPSEVEDCDTHRYCR